MWPKREKGTGGWQGRRGLRLPKVEGGARAADGRQAYLGDGKEGGGLPADLRMHDHRHSFPSALANRGAPLRRS
jgi:hypothetical protein